MRMALHTRMLLGGVIGAAGGVLAHLALRDTPLLDAVVRYVTNPVGQIFLRLLFMLVIPLIFSALVMGVAGPLGIAPEAASYDHFHAIASHPLGRLVLLAAMALPLWGGAHHLRHLWLDFGGLKTDGLVGALCYGGALVGSLLAIVAVVRL